MGHSVFIDQVLKLKLSEQRIDGMYSGYFHTCVLVEHENGERQVIGWEFLLEKQNIVIY